MKATDIFQFDKNIPPELLPRITELVTPLVKLIPKWCQKVEIRYSAYPEANGVKENTNATACIQYEYRKACIDFYPSFFNQAPDEQINICIHEFVHLTNLVVIDYAEQELERLLPKDNDNHKNAVTDEFAARLESVTQDMCWIIRGLMNE